MKLSPIEQDLYSIYKIFLILEIGMSLIFGISLVVFRRCIYKTKDLPSIKDKTLELDIIRPSDFSTNRSEFETNIFTFGPENLNNESDQNSENDSDQNSENDSDQNSENDSEKKVQMIFTNPEKSKRNKYSMFGKFIFKHFDGDDFKEYHSKLQGIKHIGERFCYNFKGALTNFTSISESLLRKEKYKELIGELTKNPSQLQNK